MPGFVGTGPFGLGPRTGGGRGFCSPWGRVGGMYPYGIPRRGQYIHPFYAPGPFSPGAVPFASQMTTEQELDWLKKQAQAMRDDLQGIEAQIEELKGKK